MADALIPGLDTSALLGATDGVTQAILWVLGIGLLGFIAWLWTFYMSFKMQATVIDSTKDGSIIRYDKIRIYNDKSGVPRWMLWGNVFKIKKTTMTIPDNSHIMLTAKGKKIVFLTKSPLGELIPTKPNYDLLKKTAEFDEFTTIQRQDLIHQYRESEAYKPKNNLKEMALVFGPIIAVILILAIFMIFFNDTVAPSIDLGKSNQATMKEFTAMYKEMAAACREKGGPLYPSVSPEVTGSSGLPTTAPN
jgi:cytochrome c-type biogenesis protein CcmH/NrfF